MIVINEFKKDYIISYYIVGYFLRQVQKVPPNKKSRDI